jgi:hypothetical protein
MKRLVFISTLVPLTIFAQSPGGVSNTNTTLQLWLKADAGITTSNNKVTNWNDQSGNNRHHTQTTDARRPVYINTGVNTLFNFNPTVDFQRSSSQRMETPSFHTALINSLYVFVVSRLNTGTGYGGNTWHTTYGFNSDCLHSHWFGIKTCFRVACLERDGAALNETFALNSYILPRGTAGSDPSPRVIWNGTPNTVTKTNYTTNNNIYTIGCDRNYSDHMNGDIAEVIIYTGNATNADIPGPDLEKIQSYLALKYGITLAPATQANYVNSGNITVWTGSSNTGYQNHIFGIGRDSVSALHQKISKSINDENNLILSTNSDFSSSNSSVRPDIPNMNFLMVGDNGLSTAYSSFNYSGTTYAGIVNSLMPRIWKAQETGETGTVYLKSNNTTSRYLIVSNDATFDDTDTWILLSGNQTTSVNIGNGQYFTFAGYAKAPGGELSGLQLWLRADDGTSTSTHGANLSYWNDNSPHQNHHVQNTPANQPEYSQNHFNYNPAVYFDGSDAMTGNALASGQEAVHVFAMSRVNDHGWRTIYGFGLDQTHVQWYNAGSLSTKPSVWTSSNQYPPTALDINYGVASYILPKNGSQRVIHWNGVPGNIGGTNNYGYNANIMGVGSDVSNNGLALTENMLGNIAEVIIYKTGTPTSFGGPVSGSTIEKIQSYLALKYGVTLAPASQANYLNSGSNTIWTGSSNSGYQNNIFGIGRDDVSGLHQRISKSINDQNNLIISTNNDFSSSNATGRPDLQNMNFLIVGDNGLSTVYGNFNYSGTAHNGVVNSLMPRVWKAQETGETGTVYLKSNNTNSRYLIVSNDTTFDDNDTWILLSGNQTASVNIGNGQYFTFAGFARAPGGELSGLQLWLKADAGTSTSTHGANLTYWNDNSPSENHHVQNNFITQPEYTENFFNYNPAVYFDGSDAMTGNAMASGQEAVHVFAMSRVNDNGWRTIYGFGLDQTHVQWFNLNILNPTKPSVWTSANHSPGTALGINYGITSYILPKNGSQRVIHWNGVPGNIGGTNNYGYNSDIMGVGSDVSNNGLVLTENMFGNIAEIIIHKTGTPSSFGGPLSNSAIEKTQSYLAIKYGITLATDYKNSANAIVFTNSSPYNRNIIGIGRDDVTDLTQKQSKTISDTTRLFLSSLAGTNASNTGIFSSDRQYIIIGDDNKALRTNTIANTEKPSDILTRIEREWKVSNTNFDGSFSMNIKLRDTASLNLAHPGNLRLLVDDDGNFSNAGIYSPTFSYSHPVLTISGISASMIPSGSTRFITIGRINPVVLPITLLRFEATNIDNRYIDLHWETASETNNDYFTIERSVNGVNWQGIASVKGAGNSTTLLNYVCKDHQPLTGVSYYRLKQTDYDRNCTYSSIRAITLDDNTLKIYPNPVSHLLTIEGKILDERNIRIFSALGTDVTSLVHMTKTNESKIVFDFSNLASGSYLVKVGTITNIVYKQ